MSPRSRYEFVWQGETVRESTKQGNDKVARQMEAAHRTSLAKGEVGYASGSPSRPSATFALSVSNRGRRPASRKAPLQIGCGIGPAFEHCFPTSLWQRQDGQHRQADGKEISTINSSLCVLRRILRFSVEWGVIEGSSYALTASWRTPSRHCSQSRAGAEVFGALPGATKVHCHNTRRQWDASRRVLQNALGEYQLAERQEWSRTRHSRQNGCCPPLDPMTPRVRFILEARWEFAEKPAYGWVWPAPTQCGQINHASQRNNTLAPSGK